MKIETFATLQSVIDTGTLAGAARLLHLTPSAVSMQMKQLEEYVGQQLFDRSGLEVKALPGAYELSEMVSVMLDNLEGFRRRTTVVVEGYVKLGMIESMQPLLLPFVLRMAKERHPKLHIQTLRGKSAELTHAVKAGELDGAVVAEPERGGSSRMFWRPLIQQEIAIIVPPHEHETSLSTLMKRYDWIRYDRGTVSGGLAARYVNQHVRDKQSSMELDGVRAIIALVSAGLGISLIQLLEPGLTTIYPVNVVKLKDAPVVRFALVTRKADMDSRPLSAVADILMQAAASRKGDPSTLPET